MQNLFHDTVADGIIDRLSRLQPGSKALWGKMNVGQMMSHCQAQIEVALGQKKLKRSFIGFLFGGIARKQFMKETPVRKNLPTDKNFVRRGDHNFYQEREKLQALIEQFARADQQAMVANIHPFFGEMTVEEWGKLTWKHLNHHLQQFGV